MLPVAPPAEPAITSLPMMAASLPAEIDTLPPVLPTVLRASLCVTSCSSEWPLAPLWP